MQTNLKGSGVGVYTGYATGGTVGMDDKTGGHGNCMEQSVNIVQVK